MYVVLNEFNKAQDTLQQLYELNPDNTNILLRKFLLARAANDEALINQTLEKIRTVIGEKTGEYQFAVAAQIVWQIRNNKLKKDSLLRAKDLLKVAYQARTNWLVQLRECTHVLQGPRIGWDLARKVRRTGFQIQMGPLPARAIK